MVFKTAAGEDLRESEKNGIGNWKKGILFKQWQKV